MLAFSAGTHASWLWNERDERQCVANPWEEVTVTRAAVLALLLVLFIPLASAQQSPATSRAVFINLTSGTEDLHAASMGLALAANALTMGRPVIVFLNVHAAKFAAADLPASVKFADFPPVRKMLADLLEHGAKVYVCLHCAHIAKVPKENFAKGMIGSEHGDLLNALPENVVSFSY